MVNNKSALITASSGGLGKTFSLFFAEKGYDIILHGRKDQKIESTKKELKELGIKVWDIKGDLRKEKTIEDLYTESKKRDISILINNAAIPSPESPLEEMTSQKIDEIIATNFRSRIKLVEKIYPLFKAKREGVVVNINSILGIESKKYKSVHSAAVWGLRGFSKSLRIEAEENNVRVISVYPTRIRTRPEYAYGMMPEYVAQKIYDAIINNGPDELVLDGRPPEFRPKVGGEK